MAKFAYPYSRFRIPSNAPYPQGLSARRPMAIATLRTQAGENLRCLVCLDTGADSCLFPLALAIALKLDVLSFPKTMTGGVGASANVTYYGNLTIDIGNGIQFDAYVGFTEGLNAQGIGLLGQNGFFSAYDVQFSHRSNTFTIDVP